MVTRKRGRPQKHGEATVVRSVRIPLSVDGRMPSPKSDAILRAVVAMWAERGVRYRVSHRAGTGDSTRHTVRGG
jgi:hypothetical protein